MDNLLLVSMHLVTDFPLEWRLQREFGEIIHSKHLLRGFFEPGSLLCAENTNKDQSKHTSFSKDFMI